jgi:hypothetical protein
MELDNIRARAKDNELRARAVRRPVESPEFEEALGKSTAQIDLSDPNKLRKWIRKQIYTELEDLAYADLRALAASKGVVNYSRMNKDQLLGALYANGMVAGRKPAK